MAQANSNSGNQNRQRPTHNLQLAGGLSMEEQNIMRAMEASNNAAEEERLLQMALEASNQEPVLDPDNPDVDSMTYE